MKNPLIDEIEEYLNSKGLFFDNDGSGDETYNINIGVPRKVQPVEFLRMLSEKLTDNRDDISDCIESFLCGDEDPLISLNIHRYVRCRIPETDIEVEFDKSTNHFEYHLPGEQWKLCTTPYYWDDESSVEIDIKKDIIKRDKIIKLMASEIRNLRDECNNSQVDEGDGPTYFHKTENDIICEYIDKAEGK